MYYTTILSIVESILIAFVASIITVRLSLHKFASSKWWERREKAYTDIIGTLSHILVKLRRQEDHYLGIDDLSDDELRKIYEDKKIYREEIERAAREGSFRISDEASNELWSLWKELGKGASHPVEGIHNEFEAVESCREKVSAEAKRDLGLEYKWYQLWRPT